MQAFTPTFSDFQNYLRWPNYQQPLTDSSKKPLLVQVRTFLSEYPLLLSFMLLSTGMVLLMEQVTGVNIFTPLLQRYTSSIGILVAAVPVAVILEEVVFRAILRLTPNRLRNTGSFLVAGLVGYCYQHIPGSNHQTSTLWFVLTWGVAAYALGNWLKRPAVFNRIHAFWQANFRWIYYAITGLYACSKIHDGFNALTGWQLLILPLMLLIGLLSGSYYGYIRMKYGFWYAVAVHSLMIVTPLTLEVLRTL